MIRHNDFSRLGGKVQSLAFVPEGGEKSVFSVGIAEPGRHVFTHTRDEYIRVTSGKIVVNRKELTPSGPMCFFAGGGEIVFEVAETSTYLCTFPNG